jgi:hypothetical protein
MMKVCKHIKNILEEIKNGNKNNKNGNWYMDRIE